MSDKFQMFNGYKFTRDDKTGYYLNSTIRMRMHRYVWEYYHGKIPKGYHIHHIDGDKANNDISNLRLLTASEHEKLHMGNISEERLESMRRNMEENVLPKAIEWHKSEEGREWHRRQYQSIKDKMHESLEFKCGQCGKTFIGKNNGQNRFCSNACKSAWRRASGIDDVKRTCEWCGKEFTTNKYSKIKTCGRSCSMKLRHSKDKR